MNPISKMLITQAESIEGYSPKILLEDLLASQIKLVNYQQAAQAYGLNPGTIATWVSRGLLKRYGTGGVGARVNLYEVAAMQLEPVTQPGKYARKVRTVCPKQ